MSTKGERLSKVARMKASNDTCRLQEVPILRRRSDKAEDVQVKHIVQAWNVKKGVVLLIVWENPDTMANVKLGWQSLDAKWFGWLLCRGKVWKTTIEGRLRLTVYEARRLHQEVWCTPKTYAKKVMDMRVLRYLLEDVYVKQLSKFAREVDACRHPEDCMGYCMLF